MASLLSQAGTISPILLAEVFSLCSENRWLSTGLGPQLLWSNERSICNNYIDIAAGYEHAFALWNDGSIVAWGRNDFGQCNVPDGNDFVAIESGNYFGIALRSDGSLAAWGWNVVGQVDVPAGNDFVAISSRASHSLAMRADGSLVAWGANEYGQCDIPAFGTAIWILWLEESTASYCWATPLSPPPPPSPL